MPVKRRFERYKAIDVTLDTMRFKILRAIRFFDRISPSDLAVAIQVPGKSEDRQAQNNFHVALSRLNRDGFLDTFRPSPGRNALYSINQRGRELLKYELSRGIAA